MTGKRFTLLEINKLLELNTNGWTHKEIGLALNRTPNSITSFFSENKIDYYWSKKNTILHNNKEVTSELKYLLSGMLLGDGCIQKAGSKSKYEKFTISGISKEYIEYCQLKLSEFNINGNISVTEPSNPMVHGKTIHKKRVYGYSTPSWANLSMLKSSWYLSGTKKIEIPEDVDITPTTLLHWYIGDGCLSRNRRRISIATNSFSLRSLEIFLQKVNYTLGINAGAYKHSNTGYYTLIPGKDARTFLEYIGECPVNDYSYKWAMPDYKRRDFLKYNQRLNLARNS